MSSNITPIDISKMPDLVRIVEDMKVTKKPRLLKQGGAPVAMLVPMATATERHQGQESTGDSLLRREHSVILTSHRGPLYNQQESITSSCHREHSVIFTLSVAAVDAPDHRVGHLVLSVLSSSALWRTEGRWQYVDGR